MFPDLPQPTIPALLPAHLPTPFSHHHFMNKPPPRRPLSSSAAKMAFSFLASFYLTFTVSLRSHLLSGDLPTLPEVSFSMFTSRFFSSSCSPKQRAVSPSDSSYRPELLKIETGGPPLCNRVLAVPCRAARNPPVCCLGSP